MKIIISHDVDHLFNSDHLFDLFFPKMWVREIFTYVSRRITFREWYLRMISPFRHNLHNIDQLMSFDMAHWIPSSFFFGMENGLGMSYKKEKALPTIDKVFKNGFDVGVHGISYDNPTNIQDEFNKFIELVGQQSDGIRMHYVRFCKDTFYYLSNAGYSYDSTEFDKEAGCCLKNPYKIGKMWEFPLCLMDSYLPYDFDKAKKRTIELLNEAKNMELDCFTVLFHDKHFCDDYAVLRNWYEWFIEYCERNSCVFISYNAMIDTLEGRLQNA